jgi:hypothetical protein
MFLKTSGLISAFTLIFMVSASAQDGMRRGDQRFTGEQQRRDWYEPQRRREYMRDERRDNRCSANSLGGGQTRVVSST